MRSLMNLLFLFGMVGPTFAESDMDRMKACMAVESGKSNDSRGGMSASEYCAAIAILGR